MLHIYVCIGRRDGGERAERGRGESMVSEMISAQRYKEKKRKEKMKNKKKGGPCDERERARAAHRA
jgi:hypothetical protein